MALRNMTMMKGIHKLKLFRKKIQLTKYNFIMELQYCGYARLPDELRITKYPITFRYYDPMPKIIEKYSKP